MQKRILISALSVVVYGLLLPAQKINWIAKDAFQQKVFIENKGQFEGDVKYAFSGAGIDIYFTAQGVTWHHDEIEKITAEERERTEHGFDEKIPAVTTQFVHMEWLGANPDAQIVAEDLQKQYFTYPSPDFMAGIAPIKALAYKKITYRNIYPNVDVEYLFPEEKSGIKYNIILHVGADASLIKMKYSGQEKIYFSDNNIIITSPFGEIIDHAPNSFYENGETIKSSFELKENVVSFQLQTSKINQTIIIDPWVTNPVFPTYNAAYDVEYDFAGNVYIHGGSQPYREIKLNSSGAILWTFTATLFTVAGYYGDFCVDGASQSSYIVEAYRCCGLGTRAYKVDPSGIQSGFFTGNNMMQEFWRCQFDNCNRKVILVGSSFVYASNYQACILDTNLTAITPSNPLGLTTGVTSAQDMCLLTLDNFGNCFMADCGNQFLKVPTSTLSPTAYIFNDNYAFTELSSIAYVKNTVPAAIGMNGMAASQTNLYTYDGKLIQRWNKNTGALFNGTNISPTSFRWGGIATDDCDNIFVGNQNNVIQYDTNFAVVNTIPMAAITDTVYDVRLAPGNLLYACGLGFVASISISLPSCLNPLTLNVTSTTGCTSGSATVNVTGGGGSYTYQWNPSGQTTQTATALASGTYTVTVTDNSYCTPMVQTATVTITLSGGSITLTNSSTNATCTTLGTATTTPTGGTAPYTYSWSNGQTTATATGLSAGSYTITVTDINGCTQTATVTIINPSGPTASISSSTNVLCNGGATGSVMVTASGGTPGYSYIWNPSGQTTANATGLVAGTYTVTVTDASGCTSTQTVTITQPSAISASTTSTTTACSGSTGTATVTASGGTGTFSYSWSPGGQTSAMATGISAGTYTVTVIDINGCTTTATVVVAATGGPTAGVSPSVTIISGNSTTLTATGGGNYSWSPATGLSATTGATVTASPTQTTTYCVTVSDTSACVDSQCVVVYVQVDCDLNSINDLLPNAFSPNNDSKNDKFCVPANACIKDFVLKVFDRWGEKVFETTTFGECWNGKYKNKELNTAVFVFYLEGTLINGDPLSQKGTINLIK